MLFIKHLGVGCGKPGTNNCIKDKVKKGTHFCGCLFSCNKYPGGGVNDVTNWEKIREEWETSKITFKELAEKHDLKDTTVRSRKNREKWQRNATKKNATQRKNVATEKSTPKKVGAPKGNKRAVGNRGNPNPVKKFTKRNTAAVKHGFFSKYLPEQAMEIMDDIKDHSVDDMLWEQIMFQYTAILHGQRVMWVESSEDHLKEQTGSSFGESVSETHKVSFAYERYQSFLTAQSRAMAELRNLIKQFLDIAHEDDERRLRLELMTAQVTKLKAETENEESGTSKTIILTNEDEMRKVIAERKADKEDE